MMFTTADCTSAVLLHVAMAGRLQRRELAGNN
jgi:hypothetical protein